MEQNPLNYRYFPSRPCTMINPHWLELPMSRTIFYGPKDVRAIEIRLYAAALSHSLFLSLLYCKCSASFVSSDLRYLGMVVSLIPDLAEYLHFLDFKTFRFQSVYSSTLFARACLSQRFG